MLFLAVALSYTDRFILNVLLIPIRGELALTDVQVSLLQGAAFALVYAGACIGMGALADRINRRNLIGAGAVIWCIGTGCCGLANDFSQFFAARIVVGLGEACLFPCAVSILSDEFPPTRRGFALGILFMGTSVGGGASVALGGSLLTFFEANPAISIVSPWRMVLVALAIGSLMVPLMMLAFVQEPDRTRAGSDSAGKPSWHAAKLFIRANRTLLLSGLAATASMVLTDFGVAAWTPTFFVRRFGLGLAAIDKPLGFAIVACGGLGALVGAAATDWVAARFGESARLRVATAGVICSLPTIAFAIAGTTTISILLFVPYLFLISFAETAGTVAVQSLAPPNLRGLLIGVQAFTQVSLGLGFGPTLVAATTEHVVGDPMRLGLAMFLVALLALLLALGMLLSVWRSGALRESLPSRASLLP